MGKERAVKALRDYLKLARIDGPFLEKRIAASIDTSDQSCLELLIPLSFERIDPTEKLPERDWENRGYQLKHDRWPYLVRLEGDIPFHVVRLAQVGSRSTTAWLVDWAEDHARLRPGPLSPVSDPLEAAERICQKEGNRSGMNDDRRRYIRMQAVRMVVQLLDDAAAESDVLDVTQWEKLKTIVGKMHLQWDAGRQKYVSQSAARK